MKFFLIFIPSLIIAALLCPVGSARAGVPDNLAARARATLDQGVFEFDATEAGNEGANIEVRCVSDCDGHTTAYRENTGLSPLYVMLPKEGSQRFISVWMSASTYWVMVHQVGDHKIVKLLEDGTRTPPVVALDEQGNERIVLCAQDRACRTLQWEGDRYVAQKTKPVRMP